MRRVSRAKIVVLSLVLAAILIADQLDRRRRGPPPPGVQNLDSFLRWRKPGRYHLVAKGGREHLLLACGPVGWLFRGAPSAYVFDKSGQLVDWTAGLNDRRHYDFMRRWPLLPPRRELDRLADVIRWPDRTTSQTQPSAASAG